MDHVVFYEKPFLKFERLLETYVANADSRTFNLLDTAMPIWLRDKLFQKSLLGVKDLKQHFLIILQLINFYLQITFTIVMLLVLSILLPFQEAVILTLDGVGEWATTTVSIGKGNNLEIVKEIHFPHSLGLLYSAFTYYLGFKVNSGEYKVMGLAPYTGNPSIKN